MMSGLYGRGPAEGATGPRETLLSAASRFSLPPAIELHTFGLVTPRPRSLEENVESRIASG